MNLRNSIRGVVATTGLGVSLAGGMPVAGLVPAAGLLAVAGLAKPPANVDDTLDTIAAEVETALGADLKYELTGIAVDFDESLEKPAGRIVLTFSIRYFTTAGAPGTVL